jgi:hypothetical protein
MDELMKAAIQQGLGYGLFVFLLLYVLKTTGEREKKSENRELKYQSIIEKLTEKFNILENVKDDVKEIKSKIERKE